MIKIVYKKPNEKPTIIEAENTLEKFQELVGGYIEILPANDDKTILMIVNEEGKIHGLQNNILWMGNTSIVGNVVFIQNGTDGEFHGLTDDMANAIIRSLS